MGFKPKEFDLVHQTASPRKRVGSGHETNSSWSPDASPERSLDEDDDNEQEPAMDLDQVSTCSEAAKEIEEFDQQELEHDIAFSDRKRLGCFSHTLQLVVHKFDTMQSSKRALQSAHQIVKKFSKSVKANEKLISRCSLKLIADCPTRWNILLNHSQGNIYNQLCRQHQQRNRDMSNILVLPR